MADERPLSGVVELVAFDMSREVRLIAYDPMRFGRLTENDETRGVTRTYYRCPELDRSGAPPAFAELETPGAT